MKLDEYSNPIFEDEDVLDFMYENPDQIDNIKFHDILTTDTVEQANNLLGVIPKDLPGFDETLQTSFLINDFVMANDTDLSINAYINLKDQIFATAQTQKEAGRMEVEFREFERRGLQKMLLMLNIMVKEMRMSDIVWGVGRGSSVASYVLYKIGIHKIDSLKYNLDHREFFK